LRALLGSQEEPLSRRNWIMRHDGALVLNLSNARQSSDLLHRQATHHRKVGNAVVLGGRPGHWKRLEITSKLTGRVQIYTVEEHPHHAKSEI
jgi:hypothetical protein